jgi:hypothetical protein
MRATARPAVVPRLCTTSEALQLAAADLGIRQRPESLAGHFHIFIENSSEGRRSHPGPHVLRDDGIRRCIELEPAGIGLEPPVWLIPVALRADK